MYNSERLNKNCTTWSKSEWINENKERYINADKEEKTYICNKIWQVASNF